MRTGILAAAALLLALNTPGYAAPADTKQELKSLADKAAELRAGAQNPALRQYLAGLQTEASDLEDNRRKSSAWPRCAPPSKTPHGS